MAGNPLQKLLASSLPLEHQVAAVANNLGFFNCGEFSYSRVNEQGHSTDFSVDLLVMAEIFSTVGDEEVDKNLNVLMECKYASPSVVWVFSTAPKFEPLVMSAFTSFTGLGRHVLRGFEGMHELEPPVYCTRGVSLSSSSADPAQIRHGLQQIRFAVPELLKSLQISSRKLDWPLIPIIAPILVTNAPLYVMNSDVTVATSERAESISEIATEYMYLSVYQKASPELRAVCGMSAREVVAEYSSGDSWEAVDELTEELISAAESVTIVAASHLPTYLGKLRHVIEQLEVTTPEQIALEFASLRESED